jgi:hypothetical protein
VAKQKVDLDLPPHHDETEVGPMSSDDISHQLQRRLARCRAPRRHTAITARWALTHTALAGLTIDNIVDCCGRGTIEQNSIVGALIDLHQSGDDDASTVLLSVCSPVVYGIAHHTGRSARRTDGREADRETFCSGAGSYWAALGHVLTTIDSHPPIGANGQPRVFLAHIGFLVFRSRKQIDASERRRHRYGKCHDDDAMGRLICLTEAIVDDEHRRRYPIDVTAVEDAALHSIELDRIAKVVRDGIITADEWRHLINHRIDLTTTSTTRERVAAHRTAQYLSRLVDHAA